MNEQMCKCMYLVLSYCQVLIAQIVQTAGNLSKSNDSKGQGGPGACFPGKYSHPHKVAKVKFVYEPSGPSCWCLSRLQ